MTPEMTAMPADEGKKPRTQKKSLWSGGIVSGALRDSVIKLNPRTLMKNPVMFVVEVGAVVTTVTLLHELPHRTAEFGFALQITLWLWFTVLFANFAEAMAEGRGKAQAETLRKARSETQARRMIADGTFEEVSGSKLRANDVVVVTRRRIHSRRWRSGARRRVGRRIGDHGRIRSRNSRIGR